MAAKSDLPQGTLDLLILKVIALGPVHGYAIAQRLQQISRVSCRFPAGPFILRSTAWKRASSWQPNGARRRPDATPSFIGSHAADGRISKRSLQVGSGSRKPWA